ncbi:MAG: hypothetical protein FJ405_09335 [Verrucomicrobia bacterium]|nr:hypothetical protein [Verrucomicrobiota bacterium]
MQNIRIAILLMVIFGAGLMTGRWTAPKPSILIPTASGRIAMADEVMSRLRLLLALRPEQERTLSPLVNEISEEVAQLPPASVERVEALRRFWKKMEPLLAPEQKPAFERHVRESENRMRRMILNRNRSNGLTNSSSGIQPAPSPVR